MPPAPLYIHAVSDHLDTGFATAHLSLAMAYGAIAEQGRAFAAGQHAFANQHRLPFLERSFLVGGHAYGTSDYATAIDVYTRVVERYPDNVPAMNNLALAYRDSRQHAEAESLFRSAAAADSTIANLYFGIHTTQMLQGEFAESRRTLDLIGRRFPDNPVLLTVEIQDAAARQDWEAAERHARARIAAAEDDTLQLVDPFEALAGIAMTQGRFAEAERHWRTQLALSAAAGSRGRHLFGVMQLANLELRYRNAPARALTLVDSALARFPLDSILPGDRPYYELARFYAAAGRVSEPRGLLAAAEANDRSLNRNLKAERSWTRGVLELAEGNAARAEAELRQAAATHICEICPLPDMARAHEASGNSRAAVTAYERYVTAPWLWRYEPDAVELGWAMKRLAELYDQLGENAKAAAVSARLLRLWRRGDPELQAEIADVQWRLSSEEAR